MSSACHVGSPVPVTGRAARRTDLGRALRRTHAGGARRAAVVGSGVPAARRARSGID
ncbi:MAG TPA: hypothetical protein VF054_02375 [Micromonosporaceae bacterium]